MGIQPERLTTRRGNGWLLRASYTGPDGNRHWLTRRLYPPAGHTREGRSAANIALRTLEAEAARKHHARLRSHELAHSLTVRQLMLRWLDHNETRWKPRGAETTANRVRLHILRELPEGRDRDTSNDRRLEELAGLVASKVTPQHIERHLTWLAGTGRVDRPGGLSRSSLKKVHAHLSGAFKYAIYIGALEVNPCAHRELTSVAPALPSTLVIPTAAQAARAWRWEGDPLDEEGGLRWRSFLRFIMLTGARRGEALGLKWNDLDIDAREVRIMRSVSATRGRRHELAPKNVKPRHFIADDALFLEMKEWQGLCRERFVGGRLPEWVWYSRSQRQTPAEQIRTTMHPDSPSKWWNSVRDSLGCEGVRLHDWRHYNATQLLAAGVDPATVANRLGHTVPVLLSTYAHAVPARDHAAASVIADSLDLY